MLPQPAHRQAGRIEEARFFPEIEVRNGAARTCGLPARHEEQHRHERQQQERVRVQEVHGVATIMRAPREGPPADRPSPAIGTTLTRPRAARAGSS